MADYEEWAERARKAQEAVDKLGAVPPASRLTDDDRRAVAQARELAALRGGAVIREHAGEADFTLALARTFGTAQYLLGELAGIIDRLAGGQAAEAGDD